MSKVLLFGTFDILHAGHRHLFQQARRYGDELHIILARDQTVRQVKGRNPYFDEETRYENLQQESLVHTVYLGSLTDKFSKIQEIQPDSIFLGYDQEVFVDTLSIKLLEFRMEIPIRRGIPHKENECKSSLLRPDR